MTSGRFETIPIDLIVVDRENRQRRELTGIEELAASIAAHGLINPVTVDRNHELITGERRYTACKQLGLTEITVQYIEDLPPSERKLIELEENVRRIGLPWKDYVQSVVELHRIHQEQDPKWTGEQTAKVIGTTPGHIAQILLVHRNLDHELVASADKFSVARNAAARFEERQSTNTRRDLDHVFGETLGLPARKPQRAVDDTETDTEELSGDAPAAPLRAEIINEEFQNVLPRLSDRGIRFNLFHLDLPYGVRTGDKSGQSAAKITGHYDDSPEIYFELTKSFLQLAPLVMETSAHLVFWFSMDYYYITKKLLEAAGWRVYPHPLIWHKTDNTGVLPDKDRAPRRTYETAFFCSFGDRKIVRAVANSVGAATTRDYHTSEKPKAVLEHFFRMLVDENTSLLDPTAGSGNAVRVAAHLGAAYALGIERDADFAAGANDNIHSLFP